jgi:hypothetical protein
LTGNASIFSKEKILEIINMKTVMFGMDKQILITKNMMKMRYTTSKIKIKHIKLVGKTALKTKPKEDG